MKIIAFDIWLKKTWSAIWDTKLGIAFPYKLLYSKDEISDLIETENPGIIIVWHPKINETDFSKTEIFCLNMFNEIKNQFKNKEIILIDERFTSVIAKRMITNTWISYKKWKNNEDSISAQLILETYFLQNWN